MVSNGWTKNLFIAPVTNPDTKVTFRNLFWFYSIKIIMDKKLINSNKRIRETKMLCL